MKEQQQQIDELSTNILGMSTEDSTILTDATTLNTLTNTRQDGELIGLLASQTTLDDNVNTLQSQLKELDDKLTLLDELLGTGGVNQSSQSSESTESTESTMAADPTSLLAEMQTLYADMQGFVQALGMQTITDEEGNDILAVSSDFNVTGLTTLNDVIITGDLQAGLIKLRD